MTDLELHKHARHRAYDYEREAAVQTLVCTHKTSSPTYRLERTYYLVKGLFWFAASLPAALYVLLLQSRGVTLGQIGFFYGLYAVVVALLEVPSGTLADRWGRKSVLLVGYTLTVGAQLAFLFAFTPAVLLLWALLSGAGRALGSGALEAWSVDRVQEAAPQTELQPLFARAGTAELFALTLGTLSGSALPQLFAGLPDAAVLSPLSVALVASALVKGGLIGVVLCGVQENGTEKKDHPGFCTVFTNALTLSRQSAVLRLLFGGGLASGFALAGLETFWKPRFAELLGPDTLTLSIILAGSFGAGMLGNLASIPLCRFLGGRYALVAALTQGFGGLTFIALALQTQAIPATLLFWFVYLTLGMSGSPLQTLLNRAVSSGERAAILSVASLMTYLGFFAGSVVLGGLAERISVAAAWGLAGAVLLVSTRFYLRLERGQGTAKAGLSVHRRVQLAQLPRYETRVRKR